MRYMKMSKIAIFLVLSALLTFSVSAIYFSDIVTSVISAPISTGVEIYNGSINDSALVNTVVYDNSSIGEEVGYKTAYPDGVEINFTLDGVYSGMINQFELYTDDDMNHYEPDELYFSYCDANDNCNLLYNITGVGTNTCSGSTPWYQQVYSTSTKSFTDATYFKLLVIPYDTSGCVGTGDDAFRITEVNVSFSSITKASDIFFYESFGNASFDSVGECNDVDLTGDNLTYYHMLQGNIQFPSFDNDFLCVESTVNTNLTHYRNTTGYVDQALQHSAYFKDCGIEGCEQMLTHVFDNYIYFTNDTEISFYCKNTNIVSPTWLVFGNEFEITLAFPLTESTHSSGQSRGFPEPNYCGITYGDSCNNASGWSHKTVNFTQIYENCYNSTYFKLGDSLYEPIKFISIYTWGSSVADMTIDELSIANINTTESITPPSSATCNGFTEPTCPESNPDDCWFYDDFSYTGFPVSCNGWYGYGFSSTYNPVNQTYMIADFTVYDFGIEYDGATVTPNDYYTMELKFDILLDWQDGSGSAQAILSDTVNGFYLAYFSAQDYYLRVFDSTGTKTLGIANQSTWYNIKAIVNLKTKEISWYLDDVFATTTKYYDGEADSFNQFSFFWTDTDGIVKFDNVQLTYLTPNPSSELPDAVQEYTYNPDLFCAINWTSNSTDKFVEQNCADRGFSTDVNLIGLCVPRACAQDIGFALYNWATSNIFKTIIFVTAFILLVPLIIALARKK